MIPKLFVGTAVSIGLFLLYATIEYDNTSFASSKEEPKPVAKPRRAPRTYGEYTMTDCRRVLARLSNKKASDFTMPDRYEWQTCLELVSLIEENRQNEAENTPKAIAAKEAADRKWEADAAAYYERIDREIEAKKAASQQ